MPRCPACGHPLGDHEVLKARTLTCDHDECEDSLEGCAVSQAVVTELTDMQREAGGW